MNRLLKAALLLLVLATSSLAAPAERVDVVFSSDQDATELVGYRSGAAAPIKLGLGSPVGDGVASPDGRRVAFLDIAGNDIGLAVASVGGAGKRNLITLPAIVAPAWSADGKRLIFTAVDIPTKSTTLHVINADGSGHKRVAVPAMPGMSAPVQFFRPHFSADGRRALVTAKTTGLPKLLSIDLRTGKGRYLTDGFDGSWSPDGRRLAFVRSPRKSQTRLYVAAADGSSAKPVAVEHAVSPVWSRDGSRLYFNVVVDNSELQVWSAAPDGSRPAPVKGVPNGTLMSASSKQMMLLLMSQREQQAKPKP